MTHGLFITGTDTGCGKTAVAVALIRALRARGLRVAGFKPVAAGAVWRDGEWRNDDALALREAAGSALAYVDVNPYCFAEPVSPHIAASAAGTVVDPERLVAALTRLGTTHDLVVAEGAGGWRVPLGPTLDMADLAARLALPVVLVVGLRLGCLNHARLSAEVIRDSGVPFAGWIGSLVDPGMRYPADNLVTLDDLLPAPCLGVLGNSTVPQSERLARPLALDALVAAAGRAESISI